jgi:acid phosphatase (class A)
MLIPLSGSAKLFRCFAVIATIGLLAGSAAADESLFLKPGQIELETLLPPPPAEGSAQAREELAELHSIEAGRSPVEIEEARRDASLRGLAVYQSLFGEQFTAENLPALAKLFDGVYRDAAVTYKTGKIHWQRQRPAVADPSLHPVCPQTSDSYPSGHSTVGWAEGVVLAAVFPERQADILGRAREYAYHRLICGVHYRSDVVAGQVVGTVVALDLLQNADFLAEVRAARAELERTGVVSR